MRPVCNCSFILYFQQDVKFDGLCGGYCFWKKKCKKMLHSTSQERTQEGHLTRPNPISREDRGHISGEGSGHTSILCQERTVNTPQSWPGENSEHRIPTYQERPHLNPGGEKHLDP